MKSSVTKPATAVEQCQVKSRKAYFFQTWDNFVSPLMLKSTFQSAETCFPTYKLLTMNYEWKLRRTNTSSNAEY